MGRGRWLSIPKDEISLLEIRSKIERQGVLKRRESFDPLRFVFILPFFNFSLLSIPNANSANCTKKSIDCTYFVCRF